MSAPAATDHAAEVIPFSRLVRERSSGSHRESEGAGFMHGLLKGEASRDDYVALVSQHWAIYEALEGAEPAMREVPLVAPFLSPALTRLPALETDLAFLIGDDWRERLVLMPATIEYAARIREVADLVTANGVSTIYYETLVDPKVAQTLADETGATTAVLDPLEGLSLDATGDYTSVMRENLATLVAGQSCS